VATLVLGAAGAAIGGSIGGAILGVSAATIGGFVGSTIGSVVDSWIVSSLAPTQRIEGPRLDSLRITSSTEGAVIPRVYGRMRMGGNVIWATDFREETKTSTQGGGKGGGGGGKVKTTEYLYYASFAVALCEGPITGIGRIWADGKLLDTAGITWRWYPGDDAQTADSFIAAKMGAVNTPAYRGTAYVVFEDLPLGNYGNRLPQLSFEVFRPLADPDTAEGLTQAVTMIPASGEFTYATTGIRKGSGGAQTPENLNALSDTADMVVALDRLQAMAPKVESVSLVVAWFGNDLRAGDCTIRPGVEVLEKTTSLQTWSVNGVSRSAAHLVSRDDQDRPVYGGTPADFAVVQAIREMKARGLRVTFYPFILMDVPPGNSLPNPYSDNAAETGQPAFPWRGRITCSPAAGYAGSVDKTATAASQVSAFFGSASSSDFAVSGENVSWTGSAGDWGLRRMVLHYAHLCAAAGGVDAFLIGTEMRGLTTIRSGAATYPAVQAFRDLAADVRSILGAGTAISYAADWSEYFGHQPGDGSGDVFFHLDPLWADPEIDFVAIDNYMPLSDWRDGFEHADAQEGWPAIYDRAYLQGNIAGGEGFDWFYASAADRSAQVRTAITDGAAAKPWVFRFKDLRAWWSSAHYDRPAGVESGTPTAWAPQSKPIWFTELGCPAIDRGTNQPNVFFDPKSSESFVPYFSRGWRDDAIQRAYLEATYLWWGERAGHRERARRLGDRAGGRGRTSGAGPLSSDAPPAGPARHRERDGQSGAHRRAGRGARRQPRIAADRRSRSRHPLELAHRSREPPCQRRDLCRADLHARGRWAATLLRRSCRAAVAQAACARRSDDTLDPPVPCARRRQLGRCRSADGGGTGSLRGRNPRRCNGKAAAEHRHRRRRLHRRPADRRLGRAARARRHARRPHLPALRPRGTGRAENRHADPLKANPCPTPPPISCCPTSWRRRPRSTSPTTRR
jgi:hypothetical protein